MASVRLLAATTKATSVAKAVSTLLFVERCALWCSGELVRRVHFINKSWFWFDWSRLWSVGEIPVFGLDQNFGAMNDAGWWFSEGNAGKASIQFGCGLSGRGDDRSDLFCRMKVWRALNREVDWFGLRFGCFWSRWCLQLRPSWFGWRRLRSCGRKRGRHVRLFFVCCSLTLTPLQTTEGLSLLLPIAPTSTKPGSRSGCF